MNEHKVVFLAWVGFGEVETIGFCIYMGWVFA